MEAKEHLRNLHPFAALWLLMFNVFVVKIGSLFLKKRKEYRFNQKIMAFQEITKPDLSMGHRQSKAELKDSWQYDHSG